MMRALAAACLLALPALGCAVSAGELEPGSPLANECQTDSDCPAGGRCAEGICAGRQGEITSLLLSVTPPANDPRFAGVTFYENFPENGSNLPRAGASNAVINLNPLVRLTGTMRIDPLACPASFILGEGQTQTVGAEGSIPAEITFTPSQRARGVPTDIYRGVFTASTTTFSIGLPPAEYDVYIRPFPQDTNMRGDTPCAVPPRLLLKQSIAGNLEFKLASPSKLEVHVIWAKGMSPAGWTVDLVEPDAGRALAVPRVIGELDRIAETDHDATFAVTIDYAPVYAPDAKGVLQPMPIGTSVIRLTPPEGLPAPALLAQLTGAQIGDDPATASPAIVRQGTPLPAPVSVEFQTALAAKDTPVPAAVRFTATELEGISDVYTSFARTVAVGADGKASVELPPGTYRVVATPNEACGPYTCLGSMQGTWVVAPEPLVQAGKLIEFGESAQLFGRAVVASGASAEGATVRAITSPSIIDFNVMNQGDGTAETLPRASFGLVDEGGDFAFGTDIGTFDVRVEPDPDTGFGWLVRPRVTVEPGATDVGRLSLGLPIVYQGVLSSGAAEAQTTIPAALIRAYVYVTPAGELAARPVDGAVAVQVAETHSDDDGAFTLLIPPSIDLP